MALQVGAHGVTLTYEDYAQLPDDGRRYEIIEGVLYVSPSPSMRHQYVVTRLTSLLDHFVHAERLGMVLTAPFDMVLSNFSVVQPDILYISRARRHILTETNVQGAPDLVVEVISPSSTAMDQTTKRQLYAQYGIPFYWVIHPINRWVRAFELRGTDYAMVSEANGDQTFSAPPFTDLAIPLVQLWADDEDE
jgi:Uma2 family endonuclease